jgi:hypothetical protein
MKELEYLIIDLDDEDREVLPKWRVKCIELLNSRFKDELRDYHTRRFSYDRKDSFLE